MGICANLHTSETTMKVKKPVDLPFNTNIVIYQVEMYAVILRALHVQANDEREKN